MIAVTSLVGAAVLVPEAGTLSPGDWQDVQGSLCGASVPEGCFAGGEAKDHRSLAASLRQSLL